MVCPPSYGVYPPAGLIRHALGVGDVGLKLHRVGTGCGNGVDEGMGQTQAPIMSLSDFADDQTMRRGERFVGQREHVESRDRALKIG